MDLITLLFSFQGRITRLPFWVVTLILIGWGSTFQQLMGPFGAEHPMTISMGLATITNFIIVVWIGLAVEIKRWHDRDKSAWWALLNLIPILGQIWIIIECGFLRGTVGDNRFGRDSASSS